MIVMIKANKVNFKIKNALQRAVSEAVPIDEAHDRSILIIRSLNNFTSRKLAIGHTHVVQNRLWQKDLRHDIERHKQRAARINNGWPQPDSDSIYFSDDGEALASVWLLALHGRMQTAWWCGSLFHYWGLPLVSFNDLLIKLSHYVPSAVRFLTAWGMMPAPLAILNNTDTKRLIAALAHHWQINSRPGALTSPSAPFEEVGKQKSWNYVANLLELANQTPWISQIQSKLVQGYNLSHYHTALWLLCANLIHRPHQIELELIDHALHHVDFTLAWRTAVHQEDNFEPEDPFTIAHIDQDKKQNHQPIAIAQNIDNAQLEDHAAYELPTQIDLLEMTVQGDRNNQTGSSAHGSANRAPSSHQFQQNINKDGATLIQSIKNNFRVEESGLAEQPIGYEGELDLFGQGHIVTHLGGLFYLINLMTLLDLPASFESNYQLQSRVGPWGTLEGIARTLLAKTNKTYVTDPIWCLLAELDQRPSNILPGEHFLMPNQFTVPKTWAPEITVVDHAICNLAPTPLTISLPDPFRRWLIQWTPLFEQALFRQINQYVSEPLDQTLAQLLIVPAQLSVTTTHLDIILPLEAISTPIRLAGLDFNPGWLPSWGKVISFHFRA